MSKVMAIEATQADLDALYGGRDPSEFVFTGVPGFYLYDNGAYVQVVALVDRGDWLSVDTDGLFARLPEEVVRAYELMTGSSWPAPGGDMIRLASDLGLLDGPKGGPLGNN